MRTYYSSPVQLQGGTYWHDDHMQTLRTQVAALEAEVTRLNHEEAEWFTAHARGFRDADKGIMLADCKKETDNAAVGWACGWLERGWQKRCEEAESQRDTLRAQVARLEERVRLLNDECVAARAAFVRVETRYSWIRVADCPQHGLFGGAKIELYAQAMFASDAASAVKEPA